MQTSRMYSLFVVDILPIAHTFHGELKLFREHQREMGNWVELFSGGYDDYRDSIYEDRVKNDLSNRASEMHFFNRNSALIYLDPPNYELYFRYKDPEYPKSTGYLYDKALTTVIKIETILFALLTLSARVDEDTKNLANNAYKKRSTREN